MLWTQQVFSCLCELAENLVKTQKHDTYPLDYLLVKLKKFSQMKYIKNELHNLSRNQWMNGCLIVYIKRNVTCSIDKKYPATISKI